MRANLAVLGILGLLAIGCSGSHSTTGPDLVAMAAPPRDLYVTWDSSVWDRAAVVAVDRLQRAIGSAVVVHPQQQGQPHIHITVDMAAIAAHPDHPAGTARVDGPCRGVAILREDVANSDFTILHEVGHILIGHPHSPYEGDLMHATPVQRPDGSYFEDFSPRESAIIRANVAAGCTRISSWAGL